MHRKQKFDAILSFDVIGCGGLAWRIARDLGIPASGWAFGDDVRVPKSGALGKVVTRTLRRLDLIFYQSNELLGKAADLLGMPSKELPSYKHVVLPHGIPEPPRLDRIASRQLRRAELAATKEQILVLYVGRIQREKGILELLDAFSLAVARDPRLFCVLIGSSPAFDETDLVADGLKKNPELERKVRMLPACSPEEVWEYLCAADIFAFASHHEGMPNSLLEAMSMEVPAIAFAIPPITELEGGRSALCLVPPFDSQLLGEAILRLADSPTERRRIAQIGSAQIRDHYMTSKNMSLALTRLSEVILRHQRVHCATMAPT
jgi:glycosyltransferase involved in cell wall biosynthesis